MPPLITPLTTKTKPINRLKAKRENKKNDKKMKKKEKKEENNKTMKGKINNKIDNNYRRRSSWFHHFILVI